MLILDKVLGWAGFKSWRFWTAGAFALLFGWLALTNIGLKHQLSDQVRETAVAESQLDTALDKNKELNQALAREAVGDFITEKTVLDNQAEIDRIRNEHNARIQEVNRQGPSGPAPAAVICAITRVCDN